MKINLYLQIYSSIQKERLYPSYVESDWQSERLCIFCSSTINLKINKSVNVSYYNNFKQNHIFSFYRATPIVLIVFFHISTRGSFKSYYHLCLIVEQ